MVVVLVTVGCSCTHELRLLLKPVLLLHLRLPLRLPVLLHLQLLLHQHHLLLLLHLYLLLLGLRLPHVVGILVKCLLWLLLSLKLLLRHGRLKRCTLRPQ